MGDSRRFDLFAKLISKHISKSSIIADVAGGQGYLQLALKDLGYKDITTFDKRKHHVNKINQVYKYFDYRTEKGFSAVVAMHPDEGTDHALMYAINNRVPAVICPCCVKPHATILHSSHNFTNWKRHLTSLAEKSNMEVIWTVLKPMTGKREVMIIKPK
jgi:hypothetical protein